MDYKNKNEYWIFGKHAIEAAIKNPNREVISLFIEKKQLKSFNYFKLLIKSKKKKISSIKLVNKLEITKLAGKGVTRKNNYAMKIKRLKNVKLIDFLKKNSSDNSRQIILLLDNITDPQNFGSILRSAAAFNVKLIIAQNINSPHESASLASAASGALDLVSICREKNITKSIHILKENGWWIFGLDMPTENHYKELSNFNHDLNKVVIVLGSEGKGIRRLIKNNCDEIVCININSNIINSLNVSNAAAIALYSFSK